MEAVVAPVPQPQFVIEYDHRDITAAVTPYITSLIYTDKLQGESDEIEIEIEDAAGRWRAGWFPEKGSRLSVQIGYAGEAPLPCGEFTIDEPEFKGPPDMVTLKGLAAGVTKEVRTGRSVGYDDQSLRDVVNQVAARHGFTVVGEIGDLKHQRITQNDETDLAFLARLARSWGYVFSIKGQQLVFHELGALDRRPSVLVVPRSIMKEYLLRPKAVGVYRAVKVSYLDPATGKLHEHTVTAPGVTTGDTLTLKERAESLVHAEALGKAALRGSQGGSIEGTIKLEGDRRIVSGNNLELPDMDRLSGLYQIKEARHVYTRSGGWDVESEVNCVPG